MGSCSTLGEILEVCRMNTSLQHIAEQDGVRLSQNIRALYTQTQKNDDGTSAASCFFCVLGFIQL